MSKFVLAVAAALALLDLRSAADPISVKWCYTNSQAKAKCEAMLLALKDAARDLSLDVQTACVDGGSAQGCMSKIKAKDADLVVLKDLDIYDGGKDYDLGVLMREMYKGKGEACYSVVVAKNSSSFLFSQLKDKKACFPGPRSGPGLVIPVGFMMLGKTITPLNCSSFGKVRGLVSAANHFGESCVPGAAEYNNSGNIPGSLCKACKSDCTKNDEYSGLEGAFKCMADGNGDVAFVTETTTEKVVAQGQHGQLADYSYLCPQNDTRAAIGSHLNPDCFVDNCPAGAVMTRYFDENEVNYVSLLMKLSDTYGANQRDPSKFQLFNSTAYGGADLLFSDSALGLAKSTNKFFYKYLDEQRFADKAAEVTCGEAAPEPPATPTSSPGHTATPTSGGSSLRAYVVMLVAMATVALLKGGV